MYFCNMSIRILAIESSCDDTSAALCEDGAILSNVTATQHVHEAFGGVFPEFASRAHMQHIVPVVDAALKKANVAVNTLDAIAFTRGPGLIGSLHVGVSFAKSLAMSLDKPMIDVNHMQAHILAHFIDEPKPTFPFLCLTVSGGHTQLVLVRNYLEFELLGETHDDAAGEAYDKIGKIFQLPYPAGPIIDKLASEGSKDAFEFPFPVTQNYNFSFSGLKTNVLYFIQKQLANDPEFLTKNINDLCASIQFRINSILISKLFKAARELQIDHVAIAGGVSANKGLRALLIEMGEKYKKHTYIPQFQYCTDNAAMIAITAYYKYLQAEFCDSNIEPIARWSVQRT